MPRRLFAPVISPPRPLNLDRSWFPPVNSRPSREEFSRASARPRRSLSGMWSGLSETHTTTDDSWRWRTKMEGLDLHGGITRLLQVNRPGARIQVPSRKSGVPSPDPESRVLFTIHCLTPAPRVPSPDRASCASLGQVRRTAGFLLIASLPGGSILKGPANRQAARRSQQP